MRTKEYVNYLDDEKKPGSTGIDFYLDLYTGYDDGTYTAPHINSIDPEDFVLPTTVEIAGITSSWTGRTTGQHTIEPGDWDLIDVSTSNANIPYYLGTDGGDQSTKWVFTFDGSNPGQTSILGYFVWTTSTEWANASASKVCLFWVDFGTAFTATDTDGDHVDIQVRITM